MHSADRPASISAPVVTTESPAATGYYSGSARQASPRFTAGAWRSLPRTRLSASNSWGDEPPTGEATCPGNPHYEQQVARLQRAGQIRIGHPCIVDAIGYGEEDGEWYLVMSFAEGVDLEIFIRACGEIGQAVAVTA